MAPLLVTLISAGSLFFREEIVQGKVQATLTQFLGESTASQLIDLVHHASVQGKTVWAVIIGTIMLIIGASTIFTEMQDSISEIYEEKPPTGKGFLRLLKTRLLSFSLIAALAFMLLVSLAVSAVLDSLGNRLKLYFSDATVIIFYILNTLLTLLIITVIFGLIFRMLPRQKIPWPAIRAGSVITAILFMIGKFAISFYISKANVGSTYGAAGALVIILVWVYYSSMILYFGAALTQEISKT